MKFVKHALNLKNKKNNRGFEKHLIFPLSYVEPILLVYLCSVCIDNKKQKGDPREGEGSFNEWRIGSNTGDSKVEGRIIRRECLKMDGVRKMEKRVERGEFNQNRVCMKIPRKTTL